MATTTNLAVSQLLAQLDAKAINFADVLAFIANHYNYTPTPFVNGYLHNAAGENEGSCKVFGFAKLNGLDKVNTLKLFAEHYDAVNATPGGTDHQNIRNFSFFGWQGFLMHPNCLSPK